MSLNALRCGLTALLGLGATVFSLSSAQTPVLPDISLAERAVAPLAEPLTVAAPTLASKSLVLTPAQSTSTQSTSTQSSRTAPTVAALPSKTGTVKLGVSVTDQAKVMTPAKPSSVPAPSKAVVKTAPVVKPSSAAVPIKINPSKINKVSSVQPALKPTTTVRYVQASSARSYVVRSTAYNSTPGQTDGSPHITATGTRTRFGVVALSRDLLSFIPYGSRIRIQDLSGTSYNRMLAGTIFIVEDTMNARMRRKVDVWMGTRSQALNWGSRSIRITVMN